MRTSDEQLAASEEQRASMYTYMGHAPPWHPDVRSYFPRYRPRVPRLVQEPVQEPVQRPPQPL